MSGGKQWEEGRMVVLSWQTDLMGSELILDSTSVYRLSRQAPSIIQTMLTTYG